MRKFFTPVSLLVLASLVLAACGPSEEDVARIAANAVQTAMAPTATPVLPPTSVADPGGESVSQEIVLTPAETLAPPATATSAPTDAPASVGPQLRTAEDMRAFGRVLGWVTGGNAGQWVAGAQIELKDDFKLNTLPDGVVFEYECVHYFVLNGEVQTKVVCQGALVRFDSNSTVPAGAVGTLWLPWAVKGSATEEWPEGFLNLPCICPDGDCRDE